MNIKENLHTYMKNCPGSFVGFFDLVSQLLTDLGQDWLDHAEANNNPKFKKWGNVFMETSKSVKQVSEALHLIYVEYENHMAEEELRKQDPVSLIENFKTKVTGIANAKRTNL